jgi:hypothetical protein
MSPEIPRVKHKSLSVVDTQAKRNIYVGPVCGGEQ